MSDENEVRQFYDCPFQRDFGTWETTLTEVAEDIKEIKKDVKAQNTRVGKLENWRWWLIGIFSAIVFIFDKFIGK